MTVYDGLLQYKILKRYCLVVSFHMSATPSVSSFVPFDSLLNSFDEYSGKDNT